ncbi:glycosyltransferase [Aureimonas sp. D3]|uniref:glycosyltransferase n=1 Tax=Aureimonas sp. D3 TaxID=1638164 RepID=UPI000785D6BD|nr:nucleotide disphospho-sugar-binding domain-containing protein [Aureimonas sp. D3]
MTRFLLVTPPLLSHVRAFEALGEALVARGHRTAILLNAGGAALVRSPDIEPLEVGPGAGPAQLTDRPTGLFGILRTVREGAWRTEALVTEGPRLAARWGAEAVLVDQMEPAGALLAEHLELPFLSVAAALPIDPDPAIPAPYLGWPYDSSPDGLKRNRGGERVARLLLRRQRETIRAACSRLGLPLRERMEDCLSPLASLSQTVAGFDYPRAPAARIAALGPFRSTKDNVGDSPLRSDGIRPLVFASLGTLQGHRLGLFQTIARACRQVGARLAIAHCGRLSPAEAATLDAELVTDFLPQRAILAEADLCICHAGLNTVLDALEAGVPVLALPIAYDQPGVAARLVHQGAGLSLSHRLLSPSDLARALQRLMREPGFRREAERLGREIASAGGAARGAELAERLVAETLDGISRSRRLKQPEPA